MLPAIERRSGRSRYTSTTWSSSSTATRFSPASTEISSSRFAFGSGARFGGCRRRAAAASATSARPASSARRPVALRGAPAFAAGAFAAGACAVASAPRGLPLAVAPAARAAAALLRWLRSSVPAGRRRFGRIVDGSGVNCRCCCGSRGRRLLASALLASEPGQWQSVSPRDRARAARSLNAGARHAGVVKSLGIGLRPEYQQAAGLLYAASIAGAAAPGGRGSRGAAGRRAHAHGSSSP